MKNKETRTFNMELRIEGDETTKTIVGHGAVFNSLSEPVFGFREVIAKGAFDDVIASPDLDCRALFNHDPNFVLGRTTARTLKLSVDDAGLRYEINPPDTQAARDLMVSMERGDITQSSFGFTIGEDDWHEDEIGNTIRVIKSVSKLFDVSPVTYPAYKAADSSLRNLQYFKEELKKQKKEKEKHEKQDYIDKENTLKLLEI